MKAIIYITLPTTRFHFQVALGQKWLRQTTDNQDCHIWKCLNYVIFRLIPVVLVGEMGFPYFPQPEETLSARG